LLYGLEMRLCLPPAGIRLTASEKHQKGYNNERNENDSCEDAHQQ